MQDAFFKKSFAFLEVGVVDVDAQSGEIDLEPIATVKGSGSMVFETLSETTPGTASQQWIP